MNTMHYRQVSLIGLIAMASPAFGMVLAVSAPMVSLPLFQTSQVLAQTATGRKAEADQLLKQGNEQFQTSHFTAALQLWEQALIIYREIKDRLGEGQSLDNLGNAYYALGDYKKAIDYQQQSLRIAHEIKDRNSEGAALGNLGLAYYALGDYKKAIDYQQQSLRIAREIKDRNSEGAALGNLGLTYYALGDYKKAIDYQQQSLRIAREIKDRLGEGQSLGNLGSAYYALGDYKKAIDYQQQHLGIAREIKDRLGEGESLGNLGSAYYALGDYKKAIDYQQQSLAIAREIKNRNDEGISLGNLGSAYYALGDYKKAIDYQQQSLAIAREIKDRNSEGAALGNLGNAYYALGDYNKAIDYHQQSLAIAREIKDRNDEGQSLGNLGNAYFSLGDYNKAIDYQHQYLAIAREIKDRLGEGQSLGNLGNAYFSLGDYNKAIDYHQQSLTIAREIKDRLDEDESLGNLGSAYYALGDYKKAIDYQQQRLTIAREIKDRNGEGQSLNNLGLAFQRYSNLPEAEKALYQGIEVWESLRDKLGNNDAYKVSIFEEQARTYRILQQVLIAENKPNEALEISERGRSRAFVDLLSSHLSNKNASQVSEQNVDKPTISLLQQIAKQHHATLVQYSIIYDDFKVEGKQQSRESKLYIWVIKPTGEITFRQADLKPLWQNEHTTLADLVDTSRQSIGVSDRGINVSYAPKPNALKPKQGLQRLHELLIKPIADLLPKQESEKVVFIPQSSLFFVPFPALQDENGKYLIEKHTILTAPSIQVLDLTRKQQVGHTDAKILPGEVLVVGNPTMPKIPITNEQLPPLPGSEQEAIQIAKLFNTKAITQGNAKKTTVVQKMANARIIHFATHGLVDDFKGFGVPGAIAFGPDGKDNGFLTSGEILDLKLRAELVVLSACDTGKGRITGDGVIGLSRSLISAGVPSVIVSLWSISDSSTSFLMTEFYKNLLHKQDKATALRQAMLTTMKQKEYGDPLYWSAFTLIGESE